VEKKFKQETKTDIVSNDCSFPLDKNIKCSNICMNSSESESDVEMIEESIAKSKKKKYVQKFKNKWKQKWTWLENMKGKSYCTLCNKTLMSGTAHLERHTESIIHKKNELIQSKVLMLNLKKIYWKRTII